MPQVAAPWSIPGRPAAGLNGSHVRPARRPPRVAQGGGRSALRYATRSSNSWTVSVSLNEGIFEEPSAAS